MAESTGYVLAAGGIVVANELLNAIHTGSSSWYTAFNWRLVPATAVMAVTLAGIEALAPAFGKGLGMLVLLSILVIPVGNAPTPLENLAQVMGYATPKAATNVKARKA